MDQKEKHHVGQQRGLRIVLLSFRGAVPGLTNVYLGNRMTIVVVVNVMKKHSVLGTRIRFVENLRIVLKMHSPEFGTFVRFPRDVRGSDRSLGGANLAHQQNNNEMFRRRIQHTEQGDQFQQQSSYY